MSSNALQTVMAQWQQRVEKSLDHWIPDNNRYPDLLHQAMRYSALSGGKRIRPLLVYATGLATKQNLDQLDGPASAIELIHAYSLVHDDLPCMDDDDLRRGQPTNHKKFGEAMAVLAGDSLQTLAFHLLSHDPTMTENSTVRVKMINALTQASGSQGMAGGQAVDLSSIGKTLSLAELEAMHIHKTGALIRASITLATLNQPDLPEQHNKSLDHYGKCLGLAFQIRDDILDIEGDTETIGKQSGADQALDKPTFPELIGMQASKDRARELHQEAVESLTAFGAEAAVLSDIAEFIVARIK